MLFVLLEVPPKWSPHWYYCPFPILHIAARMIFLKYKYNITSLFLLKSVCVCAQLLSDVQLFMNPWTVACQAPLFMEFSRREYWSMLPFPTPGGFPDPRIDPTPLVSPALADGFFTAAPPGKPLHTYEGMCEDIHTYINFTRDDSTHWHDQMFNIEIRLIIFFAAKDGEALYSQQKQDQELTVAQTWTSDLNCRK